MSLDTFMRRIVGVKRKVKTSDPSFQIITHRIGMTLRNNVILRLRYSGLRRRTGSLANSIQYKIDTLPNVAIIKVGSYGVRYAAIHEFGGTIKSKRPSGWLTIPLKKKYFGMMPGKHRGRFKIWQNPKTGKAGLIDNNNNDYAFVFKKSVEIKERAYLRNGFAKSTKAVTRILRKYFKEVFRR